MNYPFWDVDIGYGVLMGVIAVIHVFVSHFAIGGGLYLVIAERSARLQNDLARLDFLQGLTKFFVMLTLVFGALTGVGIWFIIGLLNPAATELLIHNFVFGWAAEWCFFAIEIAAALIYLAGWKTMSARNHMIVGWIYFGAAWMSLFIINGILSFMLTPGGWLVSGSFWDGFFNPTFWSSLMLRTGICIMLAGLYSLMVASLRKRDDFKARLVTYNAWWGVVGAAILAPAMFWYFNSIPADVVTAAQTMMSLPLKAWWLFQVTGIAVLLLVLLIGFILRRNAHIVLTIIAMAVGLVWFGAYEWFRESIRKPWIVYDYMYGNATEKRLADNYQADGLLAHIVYRTGDDGADLFRHACRSCHTINCYQPLRPAFDGTDETFVAGVVKGTQALRGNMPPFLGTETEADLIAAHIYPQLDKRHLAKIYGLSGVDLGETVYQVRCGRCHVFGGHNDKSESLLGLEEEDYHDLLDMAGELADEMPPFTGDEKERAALVQYLLGISQPAEGGQ